MNTNAETYYINQCLDEIEAKLGWGKREEWRNYDFEKLSAAIFEHTDVTLSVSTLRRLFGKVLYTNIPALHTLNTLAQFAGYADWRAFKQKTVQPASDQPTIPSSPPAARIRKPTPAAWLLLLLIPFSFLGYSLLRDKAPHSPQVVDPSKFSFTGNKVRSEGVPNSVIFTYNAKAAQTDSVFIAQSWDLSRKVVVPRDKTEHSSIYYYPGYFKAKLIVDTQIVQTFDLMVATDGWLALQEDDPVPVYFKKEEYAKGDSMEINEQLLKKYNIPLYPHAPHLRFFYMKDMSELRDDKFTFETSFRNPFNQGAGACQHVQILIQCKNDVIMIPLSAKACIGDLFLYAAGKKVSSRDADLSGFGCDLTQWTTLKVETVDKQMHFYVNGAKAYSLTFPNPPTDIVGVQYRFDGLGAVRNTHFINGKGVVLPLK
jgi:hypothetical protein